MNILTIIDRKRLGHKLTKEEIEFFVKEYTEDRIEDYQASALLMAICINGMNNEETFDLTFAIKNSGDVVSLNHINGFKVDKHSTGGVGDKTTLVALPIAAAMGIPIAKMSGRGLGFTGGTIDKMEAIPNIKTTLTEEEFAKQIETIGMAVIGQTAHIAPADKKIYKLRDVTSTVDSLSLIASSVMSKKLAAGSDGIVLDIKCGNGAFMETEEEAVSLGNLMVAMGNKDHKKTMAVITDMNQPLGQAIGNSLEVIEAIETLKGNGPEDITELSLQLAAVMAYVAGISRNKEEGYMLGKEILFSGKGLEKFKEFVEAQNGDAAIVSDYSLFGKAKYSTEIIATETGYIKTINTADIGFASQRLGAGREKKEDTIDMNAGIILKKKLGNRISQGEVIATIYSEKKDRIDEAIDIILKSIEIAEARENTPKLIKQILV